MTEDEFERHWRAALRFRNVSRELRGLLLDVFLAVGARDATKVKRALEALFEFLASREGRTDANCSVTDFFFCQDWPRDDLPAKLRAIIDDCGGTLHDAVYAQKIAQTFESTPEQLLARVRAALVD